MQYRKLGKTDIEVSTVAFGCWAIIGGFNWGYQDEKDSLNALRMTYEEGVTFFDTAEGYGNGRSEQLLSKALSSVRNEIIIATKVSPHHFAEKALIAACERSLRNLHTDRIDLYQLHWADRNIPIGDTLNVLEKLREEGKIRFYGVSNFGPQDISECLDANYSVSSNQLAYNLLFRAIEYEIQSLCTKEDISILCYSPLMQGLLTGKFVTADDVPEDRSRTRHFSCSRLYAHHGEDGAETETFAAVAQIRRIAEESGESMADISLAWLLAQPGVISVIAGGRNPDQARCNTHAADIVLPEDIIERLSSVTESLKKTLGPNPDMWQGESRVR